VIRFYILEKAKRLAKLEKIIRFTIFVVVTLFTLATEANVIRITCEGEKAPGTGGQVFVSFDEPTVNKEGDVAFLGSFTENGFGVALTSSKG
jgi:hypothetical protein